MKELSIDELEQNYQLQKRMQPAVQTAQATVQPQKKKKGGIGGFLTSLIGEAGGTGGALAGGATGAAIGSVVPGIGTAIGGLIGAGLGGFLGGTGGQIAENVVRDDEVNISKALKAGAVEGIMGAGPLKLLKGAAGATKAIKGAESIADISKGAESAIRTPLLSKLPGAKEVGTKMTVTSSGLKPGKEIGALENVDQTANALSELGIKGTPKQQAKQIQTKISELGKAVDDTLANTPVPLQGSMVTKALAEAMADPANARYYCSRSNKH